MSKEYSVLQLLFTMFSQVLTKAEVLLFSSPNLIWKSPCISDVLLESVSQGPAWILQAEARAQELN